MNKDEREISMNMEHFKVGTIGIIDGSKFRYLGPHPINDDAYMFDDPDDGEMFALKKDDFIFSEHKHTRFQDLKTNDIISDGGDSYKIVYIDENIALLQYDDIESEYTILRNSGSPYSMRYRRWEDSNYFVEKPS